MVSGQSSELSEKVSSYKDLLVWKKYIALLKSVYHATKQFPRDEQWALTSQIKRAIVSAGSNIVEGSSKRSTKEFIRFLNISYGSLAEVEAQLIIARELDFIDQKTVAELTDRSNEIGRMLNGLISSLHKKLNSDP